MGDEDIKADHDTAIDAFLSAQGHKSSSVIVMAAQEMTEHPVRAASLTPGCTVTAPENGTTRTRRPHKPYSKTTVVKLVSTNATSSAFPESFGFSVSATGRWLAAFSSSALYLVSTQHLPAYKGTCRAFRIRRKPLAVAITDTGRFAVLTTSHKVDIYQCGEGNGDLLQGACKKLETVHLDNEAKTLAFARCGEIVAAGSDVGLELKSLSPGSRETDKRYITCSSADRLMFARDGRGLLATSVVKKSRFSTFIALNESFEDAYVEEEVEQQPLGKLWITQLLFPERLSCRQAALPPLSTSNLSNSEILAFDSHLDMFKVFDITMKRFTDRELGTPQNVIWTRHHKPEEAIPAISADASAIAFAVRMKTDKEIWVYHVPASWWEPGETSSPESENREEIDNNLDAAESIKIPALEDGAPPETISSLQWVESCDEEHDRLVAVVSTVNVAVPEEVVPIEAPAASGKVFLFDFADSADDSTDGSTTTIVVDLGEVAISEGLTDEVLALEREVDLVRRRTQMQRNRPPVNPLPSPRGSLRRSISSGSATGGSGVPTLRDLTHSNSGRSNSGRSNSGRSARRRRSFSSLSSANEEREEVVVPVDEPYSQSQPRSQFSLHRAATIAANAPANRQHLRALPDRPLEYRRADGLREMPHESDADNWVPPPPVYSERPDNVMSHPINSQTAASYVPTPQRGSSLTQHRSPRHLSNVPLVPPLPQNARVQYTPQGPAMLPQQAVPTPNPAPLQASSGPHPQALRQGSTRSRNSNDSGTSGSSRLLGRPQTTGSSRRAHHRNAESASSTSSRTSQNHVVSQQAAQPPPPPPPSNNTNTIATTAPAISLVTHGLPPNMTPPSPIAEFVRPSATHMDTPTPNSPTAEQLSSLHRRSGSGGSAAPRTAVGSQNDASPLRITPPINFNHALPPVPGFAPGYSGGGSRSSPRSERCPNLSRLGTIASVAEHQQQHDDFVVEPHIHSANTTPETLVSRRPWWRVGGGGSARGTPTRPGSRQVHKNPRPESRVMQYAPVWEGPRYAATAPAAVGATKAKEKEGGGSSCVVM